MTFDIAPDCKRLAAYLTEETEPETPPTVRPILRQNGLTRPVAATWLDSSIA